MNLHYDTHHRIVLLVKYLNPINLINRYRFKKRTKLINNLKNQFRSFGINSELSLPAKIKNPKYIEIGDYFYLGPGSRLEAWDFYPPTNQKFNPKIKVGNNVRINGDLHIGCINYIEIKDNVLMGNGVFITDHSHGNSNKEEINMHPNNRKLYSKGRVVIEENVWIGERVIILPGVTIQKGSIIGAGAVVTHSIPAYSVAAGNPAKVKTNLLEK